MRFGKVGAVIAAASKRDAEPLFKLGSITNVRRIILTLQQAGVFPIVIVTGAEELEVIHQVASLGVIFLRNEECERPELFSSVRLGLGYLRDKCEQVVFTPVNAPMFSAQALRTLLDANAEVAVPTFEGRGGHPIVVSSQSISKILAYNGGEGLKGAIGASGLDRVRVPVDDAGVLLSVHDEEQLQAQLRTHNASLLAPSVQVSVGKETPFMHSRLKLLLFLIEDLHSVRQACLRCGLSPQKAWDMVNKLEDEVGFDVVVRRHGGSRGGKTTLTEQGLGLAYAFQRYEEEIHGFAQRRFDELFGDAVFARAPEGPSGQ